jgi:hypothetical protein
MINEEGFSVNLGYFLSAFVGFFWTFREIQYLNCCEKIDLMRKKIRNNEKDSDLVYVKGSLWAVGNCVDDELFYTSECLKIRRKVEMYLNYKEKDRYDARWFKKDFDCSKFKRRFKNPEWKLKNIEKVYKGSLMINGMVLPDTVLNSINEWKDILGTYKGKDFKQLEQNGKKILYQSKKFTLPKVGDYRVTHQYIPNGLLISILGQRCGKHLLPFNNLLLLKPGSHSPEALILSYESDQNRHQLILRLFCLLSIFSSITFLNNPILLKSNLTTHHYICSES